MADQEYIVDAHDYMPANELSAKEFDEEVKMANIFQASYNEQLTQIAFHTTHPGTTVSYEIYLNDGLTYMPSAGILMASGTVGPFEFGGYHRIDISEPVTLMTGQYYSIVICEKTSDGRYTASLPVASDETTVGIINSGESELFYDGVWQDMSDDSQKEMFAPDTGSQDAMFEPPAVAYDNFSIKGFAVPLEGRYNISLNSKTHDLNYDKNNRIIGFTLRASDYDGGNGTFPSNIRAEWSAEDESLFGIDVSDNTLSATVYSKKDGDNYPEGDTYLRVDLYDTDKKEGENHIGTLVQKISVYRQIVDGVELAERQGIEQPVYVYTGKAIEPPYIVYSFAGTELIPGEDYTTEFADNIKCGVGKIFVTASGDFDGEGRTFFAIVPAKAEIKSVAAGEESITVNVTNQSASGITGYRIYYREKGSADWKSVDLAAGKTAATINGLTAGKQYEVQVCGYVDIEDYQAYFGMIESSYEGEKSGIVTSGTVKEDTSTITMDEKNVNIGLNKTLQLKATVTAPAGTKKAVSWTSSNPEVVTVNGNGKITGLKKGTAVITASISDGKKTANCNVTVLFSDVMDKNAYYFAPVYWASSKGITNGYMTEADKQTGLYGQFGHALQCTRAHAVTFLWRMAGSPEPASTFNPFNDVKPTAYYYKAVLWASEKGIAKGYAGGKFKPNAVCLREHVVTFLWRYAGKPEPKVKKNPFNDVRKTDYYYKAALWANEKGVANGYSSGSHKGGFGPKLDCLREHVVTFLWRYSGKPDYKLN